MCSRNFFGLCAAVFIFIGCDPQAPPLDGDETLGDAGIIDEILSPNTFDIQII